MKRYSIKMHLINQNVRGKFEGLQESVVFHLGRKEIRDQIRERFDKMIGTKILGLTLIEDSNGSSKQITEHF